MTDGPIYKVVYNPTLSLWQIIDPSGHVVTTRFTKRSAIRVAKKK